ncbi:MAG TPA: antitoxin Xre/MbcA/ParS toxin-binding domain-containing protein [Opitutaceae bacterium]|jgi:putative toxin-antitoxin system antitoxin component (TIGR02293 family)
MTTIAQFLSLPLDDDLEMARRVEKGIPASAIRLLGKALELGSIAQIAALVQMSAKTAERRVRAKARLAPDESERVVRLARILSRAETVLESHDNARKWMARPLAILGGRSPLAMSATEPGARAVEQALGRLEHGVYS